MSYECKKYLHVLRAATKGYFAKMCKMRKVSIMNTTPNDNIKGTDKQRTAKSGIMGVWLSVDDRISQLEAQKKELV